MLRKVIFFIMLCVPLVTGLIIWQCMHYSPDQAQAEVFYREYGRRSADADFEEKRPRWIACGEGSPSDDAVKGQLLKQYGIAFTWLSMNPAVIVENRAFAAGYNDEMRRIFTEHYHSDVIAAVIANANNELRK